MPIYSNPQNLAKLTRANSSGLEALNITLLELGSFSVTTVWQRARKSNALYKGSQLLDCLFFSNLKRLASRKSTLVTSGKVASSY